VQALLGDFADPDQGAAVADRAEHRRDRCSLGTTTEPLAGEGDERGAVAIIGLGAP